MKKTIAAFAAFAALAASAATVRTATEAFVTNRITAATNALATASNAAYMPQTNAYTKAETDARIITTNDVCAVVTNTTFGEWQFDGTSYMFEGVSPDGQDHYDLPTTLISLQWFYATNEIPESAKSILDGLCIQINDSILPVRYAVYTIHASDVGGGDYLLTNRVAGCENSFSVLSTPTKIELTSDAGDYGFYLTRKEYNALGLARQSDIPTNHVTQAEMDAAIAGIDIPSTNGFVTASVTNGLATTNYADSAAADAVATADTSYLRFISATNVNQSVQYVSVTDDVPTQLSIELPADGRTKDWIVYVHSVTNVALKLPAVTWWMADVAYTNEVPPATPTAFYFSQIAEGLFYLGRQELSPVTITE